MPRGPKGEKRPGDVIGAAIMVGRIATGEIDETLPRWGWGSVSVLAYNRWLENLQSAARLWASLICGIRSSRLASRKRR